MSRVRLDQISFNAGTQVRAAINDGVVAQYAERMLAGDIFPPIVVFHDGSEYFLADGFHRVLAANRHQFTDIEAEVKTGTKTDALWFALGANKAHPWQMTQADKKHAILLAITTWPDRSISQIAEQIGVNQGYAGKIREQVNATVNLPDRVEGKDGKSYPASYKSAEQKAPEIERLLRNNVPIDEIKRTVRVGWPVIRKIRESLHIGDGRTRASSKASQARVEQIREMAATGHSSQQIAAAVQISPERCRFVAREHGIEIVADRVTGNRRHLDPNRIVETIVMDSENLTGDVAIIEFSQLDRDRLGDWIDTLVTSRKALDAFIRRLIKEKQKHGQAA